MAWSSSRLRATRDPTSRFARATVARSRSKSNGPARAGRRMFVARRPACRRSPADVVLLAHRLSPGAIEWLRDRGANWADEAGQARILGPDGLIVIRDTARPLGEEGVPHGFTWSRSAIIIAETILAHSDQPLRATDLAKTAGWSVPQTANVLKAFDRQGWTIKRGSERGPTAHRELVDADELLVAWSRRSSRRLGHSASQSGDDGDVSDAPAREHRPGARPDSQLGGERMGGPWSSLPRSRRSHPACRST